MTTTSPIVTLLVPGCFSDIGSDEPVENDASAHNANQAVSESDQAQHQQTQFADAHSGDNSSDQQASDNPPAELNNSQVLSNPFQSYEQALFSASNVATLKPSAIPAAQLSLREATESALPKTSGCDALNNALQNEAHHTVRADPVHLMAGTDNARLIPAQALHIQADEADAIIASINELINPDNQSVVKLDNNRWLFTGINNASLDTWPSHAVANGRIASFLPRQASADAWRLLFTEVQMLLHAHPVNMARQSRGLATINALWFWGGADLPKADKNPSALLFSDNAFAKAFAGHYQLPISNADDLLASVQNTSNIDNRDKPWVYLDTQIYNAWLAGDVTQLTAAKKRFTQNLLEPLQQALANGQIERLTLDGCEGVSILESRRTANKPWWKKWWPLGRNSG